MILLLVWKVCVCVCVVFLSIIQLTAVSKDSSRCSIRDNLCIMFSSNERRESSNLSISCQKTKTRQVSSLLFLHVNTLTASIQNGHKTYFVSHS